ncbi:hypothetical protein [Cyclobacterium sp. SYSU L10401]|uniref:hypothetical protein n=1 Tax=Cyclobacterium sp. SYSU L10401 TaxID=2678657 RepID=UPI0013D4B94F|nr:hypothetical protein [Cyclobacterium sp. SYSU L10401]
MFRPKNQAEAVHFNWQLEIFQRAKNFSQDTLSHHFWRRTLVQPGGILTVPVDPDDIRFAAYL